MRSDEVGSWLTLHIHFHLSSFLFRNDFRMYPANLGIRVLVLRATVWLSAVAACLRPDCHKTHSNQLKHTAAVCWADRVSHSEHLLSAVITARCGSNPTDSHRPHSWPVHWRSIYRHAHTRTNTHTHKHTHISAYTALCVPTSYTLLHAQPRKLCHFIFVPITISHVFSGCGWIIPRGVSACGPAGPRRAGPWSSQPPKKHVSQGEEHSVFSGFSWFCDETSADISRSFS